MYLFVFLWVPSLQDAGGFVLPLGYIFSAFMISMMLGSIVYTTIATTAKVSSPDTSLPTNGHANGQSASRPEDLDSLVVLHAKLAALVCGVAALLFAYSATGSTMSAEKRFWAFCAFEACVGMYYPTMGMLRGTLVPNEVRATVSKASFWTLYRSIAASVLTDERFAFLPSQLSSLFRVPLNIFVTVALLTGVSSARHLVFAGCSVLLAVASLACALVLVKRAEETSAAQPVENGERSQSYED